MTWRSALRAVVRQFVAETGSPEGGTETPESDDSSFREIEVVNWPATRTESLERTLDRAESVLESQLTTLESIQDKAVRTVRVELVLLGAIASIGQLASSTVPVNDWLKAGGVLVVGSILTGILTSNLTSPDFGPGPDYVRPNIDAGDPNEDVYLKLLQGYCEAISYNRSVVNDSTRYLFATQVLLVVGISVGVIGIIV